jgi:MFS family permease
MSETPKLDYETPPPPDAPSKGAMGVIFLIVLIDLLGFGIIIPLLPRYVPDYKTNALKVTLLFSVYSICQFLGAPILGLMSDRFGRRPVLAISQVGSAAGYVLLGVAPLFPRHTLALVYLSRIIDGFSGGNISTAQAYVGDVTTPQNRARAMGMLGAAFGIGFSIGPALGGVLGHYNVSLPAYVAAALSLVAAVFSWLKLKDVRVRKPTEAEAWLHPARFAPIFRKPVLTQFLVVSFFIMAAFVMMESTIVLFLDTHFGFGERGTGWFFAFVGFVIIIVQGGLIGRLVKKVGEWKLAILGPILVGLGMLLFTMTAFWPLVALLLLAAAVNAAGRGFQQPTSSSLISKLAEADEQGAVFGLYHGLGSLARVAGPIVAGLVYPFVHNTGQFLTAGAIAFAMAVWTAALRKQSGATETGNVEVSPATAAATPEPT